MASQKGIQETLDVFEFAASVVDAAQRAKEGDGKIDIKTDFVHFITPLTVLPKAVSGIEEVPAELVDVDGMEVEVLRTKFGDIVDDPDWQDLLKGTLIQIRAVRNIIEKKKAAREQV